MKFEKTINSSQVLGEMKISYPELLSLELHKESGNLAGVLYVEFSNSGKNWVRNPDADISFVGADTTILMEIADAPSQFARFGIDYISGSSKVEGFGYSKGDSE